MEKKIKNLEYTLFSSEKELPRYAVELLQNAQDALNLAFAPYSQFRVGAALLCKNGKILKGANQENASYPLCMCAERVALYAYSAQTIEFPIVAMGITAKNNNKLIQEPIPPCGACRQVIAEYEKRQNRAIEIFLQGGNKTILHFESITQLLPFLFDDQFLL